MQKKEQNLSIRQVKNVLPSLSINIIISKTLKHFRNNCICTLGMTPQLNFPDVVTGGSQLAVREHARLEQPLVRFPYSHQAAHPVPLASYMIISLRKPAAAAAATAVAAVAATAATTAAPALCSPPIPTRLANTFSPPVQWCCISPPPRAHSFFIEYGILISWCMHTGHSYAAKQFGPDAAVGPSFQRLQARAKMARCCFRTSQPIAASNPCCDSCTAKLV